MCVGPSPRPAGSPEAWRAYFGKQFTSQGRSAAGRAAVHRDSTKVPAWKFRGYQGEVVAIHGETGASCVLPVVRGALVPAGRDRSARVATNDVRRRRPG